MSLLLNPRDLDFLLYELLDSAALCRAPCYAQHDRATFDAVIATARRIAEERFAPHAAKLDANEPTFDGERVHLIPEVQEAIDAYIESGFMGIAARAEFGGMELPWVVAQAACAWFGGRRRCQCLCLPDPRCDQHAATLRRTRAPGATSCR